MNLLQKSTIFTFIIVIIASCNSSSVETNTSKNEVSADYLELLNTKDLLTTAKPKENNHFEYKKLVHSYVYNISTLTHELDSINKVLKIDSLPTDRRNQFYIDYIVYRINIGDPDSAEKLIREVFIKNPTDYWTHDYINFELNLNMSFSKLSRSDCDSATYYYHKLMNSIKTDTTKHSSDSRYYSERINSANVLFNAINVNCPNSFD